MNLKFLHEPLPSLRGLSFERALQWQLDGLARLAPRAARDFGWRPTTRIVSDQADGVRERSLLGASRLNQGAETVSALPVAVALDDAAIFETSIELPTAARDLRQAIEFRLDELSPLPPDDIVFSVGEIKSAAVGRIEVSIAIARKRDIDALIERYRGAALADIGARLKTDGQFAYRFYEAPHSNQASRRALLAAGALILGVLALAGGANAHLERRIEARAAYEGRLIAAIKDERARASIFATESLALTPGLNRERIAEAVAVLIASAPEGALIEEARLDAAGVSTTFYAPEGAPAPATAARLGSGRDRPGYVAYSMTLPFEPAP